MSFMEAVGGVSLSVEFRCFVYSVDTGEENAKLTLNDSNVWASLKSSMLIKG